MKKKYFAIIAIFAFGFFFFAVGLALRHASAASCVNPSPVPSGYAAPCPVLSLSSYSITSSGPLSLSLTPNASPQYIWGTVYLYNGSSWVPLVVSSNYLTATTNYTIPSSDLSSLSQGNYYIASWDWTWNQSLGCYTGPGSSTCNTGDWRVQEFSVTGGGGGGGGGFSCGAGCNQYYVNVNGGSDSNTGTSLSQAWKTINHADAAFVLGSAGAVIHVEPGTYADTSGCYSSTMCLQRGGSSNNARLKIVCDQEWNLASTQGCLLRTQTWSQAANYVDIGEVGAGFDIGDMPSLESGFVVNAQTTAGGVSVHFIGNYVHDIGQTAVFDGITGCIDGGVITGMGPAYDSVYGGVNTMATDFEVLNNFIMNFGIVGNGCINAHAIYPSEGGAIVENNIILNIASAGIHLYHTPCNSTISNNTIIHTGTTGILASTGPGNACPNNAGNVTISNNIIDNGLGSAIQFGAGSPITNCAANSFLVTNNMYNGNANNGVVDPSSCTDIVNNITSESAASTFVNYQVNGSGNYDLKPTSAAVNGGTTQCVAGWNGSCTPAIDFAGTSRPQGSAIDIGAFEY